MLTADEVAKHSSPESCWVIIEGYGYDVTDFLNEHPGGASIILRHAGKDATEEYVAVHPPGTIEEQLPQDKHLGPIIQNKSITTKKQATTTEPGIHTGLFPLAVCINLNDFEQACHEVASKRAWTYYSSACDDLYSHDANLKDWKRVTFRPRVLRNVAKVNMSRCILGHQSNLPVFIAPAALARLGHPDGELCLARGAGRFNIPYAVSTASSVSPEELSHYMHSNGVQGCLFFQLYVKVKKSETIALIKRAKVLKFKALLVTVDTPVVGKREADDRHKIETAIAAGETIVLAPPPVTRLLGDGDDLPVFRGPYSSTFCWEDLKWIREEWENSGPVALKGITTAEDAKIACDLGIDCIYLSNHGGRQLDSSPSSLRTLLEIGKFYPEVLKKCDVVMDGGIRRGADIIKALCLGARAVGLGRPFMYALSSHGTEGVSKVIQILGEELQTCMRLLGVTTLDEMQPHMVNTRELDILLMNDLPGLQGSKNIKSLL